MRASEFLIEYDHDTTAQEIARIILSDCGPLLSEYQSVDQFGNYPPLRGSEHPLENKLQHFFHRADRRPRDSSNILHQTTDDWMLKRFGIRFRSNATFCVGRGREANRFGDVYVFLPVGNFSYVWSPYIDDLTTEITSAKIGKLFLQQSPDEETNTLASIREHCVATYRGMSDDDRAEIITDILDEAEYQFNTGFYRALALKTYEIMCHCPRGYYLLPHHLLSEVVEQMRDLSSR